MPRTVAAVNSNVPGPWRRITSHIVDCVAVGAPVVALSSVVGSRPVGGAIGLGLWAIYRLWCGWFGTSLGRDALGWHLRRNTRPPRWNGVGWTLSHWIVFAGPLFAAGGVVVSHQPHGWQWLWFGPVTAGAVAVIWAAGTTWWWRGLFAGTSPRCDRWTGLTAVRTRTAAGQLDGGPVDATLEMS